MSHETLTIQIVTFYAIGALIVALLIRAFVDLVRWSDRRFEEQLEADFRSYVLLQESKRAARRIREAEEAEQVNLRG